MGRNKRKLKSEAAKASKNRKLELKVNVKDVEDLGSSAGIQLLPVETLLKIFSYLTYPPYLARACLVSRLWRQVGEEPKLWARATLHLEEKHGGSLEEILEARRCGLITKMTTFHPGYLDRDIFPTSGLFFKMQQATAREGEAETWSVRRAVFRRRTIWNEASGGYLRVVWIKGQSAQLFSCHPCLVDFTSLAMLRNHMDKSLNHSRKFRKVCFKEEVIS